MTTVVRKGDVGPAILSISRYVDRYVKADGQWRIFADGYSDVGAAAKPPAQLAAVGVSRAQVGPGDQRRRGLGVPGAVGLEQWRDLIRGRLVVAPPWQDPVDRRHDSSYTVMRLNTSVFGSLARPSRKPNSTTKPMPATVAPRRSTRRHVAAAVPPVARTSSIT